ncbi:MAG: glycosyltransferase family A protein [Candidatus Dependentiae bacterium]|nr:glycosyltransferase family A protein [Candidatus Dependentiae bacterium]
MYQALVLLALAIVCYRGVQSDTQKIGDEAQANTSVVGVNQTRAPLSPRLKFFDDTYTGPALPNKDGERHMVIVIASYNNKDWYQGNLDSVFSQSYKNYHVVYVDDCSADGTGELVKHYIEEKQQQDRVTLICNKNRIGALANYYNIIHMCNDGDIIVQLDGDDRLADETVLATVNKAYADSSTWLAYSQFTRWPKMLIGWNKPHVKDTKGNRGLSPSHLHTFYAKLFKKIKREDLMYEGDFFQMTWDMAIMLPMVEMASEEHVGFMPEVLYIYNDDNPINDHRVDKTLQSTLDKFIRTKEKYDALETLF